MKTKISLFIVTTSLMILILVRIKYEIILGGSMLSQVLYNKESIDEEIYLESVIDSFNGLEIVINILLGIAVLNILIVVFELFKKK